MVFLLLLFAMNFRAIRLALRLSQSALARLAGISRIRICLAELGDVKLTLKEQQRIRSALEAEATRLWAAIKSLGVEDDSHGA